MPNRIKELREKSKLTQKQLAEMVGSQRQQIYKLEKGERTLTLSWMERLAPALNCLPWELLDSLGGGLADDERDLLNKYRSLPAAQQQAVHEHLMTGHNNPIIAAYDNLTKSDREIVDWFLFEEHTLPP